METPKIVRVRIFVEPPAAEMNALWIKPGFPEVAGLPKKLIQDADRELGLDGKLIAFLTTQDLPHYEYIKRFASKEEGESFFSKQAKGLWDCYYGIGASNVRYNLLIEYEACPDEQFDEEEVRKRIYLEYDDLFARGVIEYTVAHPNPSTDDAVNFAMSKASHRIMIQYGMSLEMWKKLIHEGTEKWGWSK